MRETYEFRIWEQFAPDILAENEGRRLGNLVRVVSVSKSDPLYDRISNRALQLSKLGKSLFSSWRLDHKYSQVEIDLAPLLRLVIPAALEPSGEECGTTYDEGTACPICGCGARQTSQLKIDFRKLPKRKDIARTIGGEIIVNQRVADLLLGGNFTGFELQAARHVSQLGESSIDFAAGLCGRNLLAAAERLGYAESSWQFSVWLNAPAQQELANAASAESAAASEHRHTHSNDKWPKWYQLRIFSSRAVVVPPTLSGIDPFDRDIHNEYRCPRGHKIGLNLLSEVSIKASSCDGSDIFATQEYIGKRAGLLRPLQPILVSQGLLREMRHHCVKGFDVEIAHVV